MNNIVGKATILLVIAMALFLSGCSFPSGQAQSNGTAWENGDFRSNGERIYFTSTSERGTAITSYGVKTPSAQ